MRSSTYRNAQTSRLLRLPAELRNKIYGYVLGGKSILLKSSYPDCVAEVMDYLAPDSSLLYERYMLVRGYLNILLSCRQIYGEAQRLPFTLNTFRHGGNRRQISAWFTKMPLNMALVSTLQIFPDPLDIESDTLKAWLARLGRFKGLRRVEIGCVGSGMEDLGSAPNEVRWELELRARIAAAAQNSVEVAFFYVRRGRIGEN